MVWFAASQATKRGLGLVCHGLGYGVVWLGLGLGVVWLGVCFQGVVWGLLFVAGFGLELLCSATGYGLGLAYRK